METPIVLTYEGLAHRLLDLLMVPISSISFKCLCTSLYWCGRICRYLSLKGTGLLTFMTCFTIFILPNSNGSNAKISWYFFIIDFAFSWFSISQLSIPSKVNFLINLVCHCSVFIIRLLPVKTWL